MPPTNQLMGRLGITGAWKDVPPTVLPDWRLQLKSVPRPGSTIYRSSGSSGESSSVPYSAPLLARVVHRTREALGLTPLRPSMVVAICFGYGVFPPASFYEVALKEEGCSVLPFGSGRNLSTATKCMWLVEEGAEVVVAMPTYLLKIGRTMQELGLLPEFRKQLRFVVTGGEPLTPELMEMLSQSFSCTVFDHYGMLESPMIGGSCATGNLHVSPDFYCEVLAPDGIKESGRGQLLLTSDQLWDGIPALRLMTGDECILDHRACSCGSPGQIVKVLGRIDNERKVKGVRVSLLSLHHTLMSLPVREYVLEVSRNDNGAEVAVLRVETDTNVESVRMHLHGVLPESVDIIVEQEVEPPLGPTGKPHRFLDMRL